MPDPIEIRRLAPADLTLMRALNATFAGAFEDPASYAAAPPPDGYLRELLGREGVIVLAALADGEVAGGLTAYELDKLEQARREIYIYDLAVAAAHRRQGVARGLIGALQAIARGRGAYGIFVQADRGDEAAIALYESLGARQEVLHFDIPSRVD
jgi:aminoglycoside 3-N-acetyltransferase I